MKRLEIMQSGDQRAKPAGPIKLMASQWKTTPSSTASNQTSAGWVLNEQQEMYQATPAVDVEAISLFAANQTSASEDIFLNFGLENDAKLQMLQSMQVNDAWNQDQNGPLLQNLQQLQQRKTTTPTMTRPVLLQNSTSHMQSAGTLSGKQVFPSFVEDPPMLVTTLSPDMPREKGHMHPITKFQAELVGEALGAEKVGGEQRSFSADDLGTGAHRHTQRFQGSQFSNTITERWSCPAKISPHQSAGQYMQSQWEMDNDDSEVELLPRAIYYDTNTRAQKANNQKLMAAMSQTKVIEVVEEIGTSNLGVINIALAFNRLGKWRTRVPATQQQLKKVIMMLSSRCLELMDHFYGRHIASIAHCFAKLHVRHGVLFNALIERGMQQHVQKTFNCQDVGNLSWAFASLGVRNVEFMNSLANWVVEHSMLRNFNNQELANTAWAYATLECLHVPLMEGIAVAAIKQKNVLNAQDIANISWAYAVLGISSVDLLNALADAGCRPQVMETFTSQGIATVVWAYAKLGVLHAVFIDGLAERCLRPAILKTFKYSTGLAKAVWGFAILSSGNEALMFALADRIMAPEVFSKCSRHDVSAIMWAFAIQGMQCPQLIDILADKALDILPTFTVQHVATTMWALATLKVDRTDLMDRMANHLLAQDVPSNITVMDVSNILWACACLGKKNIPLLNMIGEQITQGLLQQLDFESVADIAWSLAMLDTTDLNLMHQLGDHVLALQDPPTLQVAANIFWAFKKVGMLRKDLMKRLCPLVDVEKDLECASAKELSTFIWALAASESPNSETMSLFIQRFGDPEVLDNLTSEDISSVAWAYATVGVADQWLLDQLASRMLQPDILEDCTEDEASQIIWAYSVLGVANQGLMHALATSVVMT